MKKENFKSTIYASCLGYVVQAIVNNFAPLLFITFKNTYNISLDKIAILVSFNFGIQLLVDLLSSKFVSKIGYRAAVVAADAFAFSGLIALSFLPDLFPDPFTGLAVSVFLYAIGGGILEVVVSPLVEACPSDKKSATMSLLHSFYCWGHVLVVVLSTLFFVIFGTENWKIMSRIWAIAPLINGIWFLTVPIRTLEEERGENSIKTLMKSKLFWIMMLLMLCSGASEQAVSQWASAFAEEGLRVSKTVGDLAGPCSFAILMGLSRLIYAIKSDKIKLYSFMMISGILCVVSYLTASLSPFAPLNLLGCAICGLAVGIMWPGTYSLASKKLPKGGTPMFALLALAGDMGCSSGPALVGFVSEAFSNNMKLGILVSAIFPVLFVFGLIKARKKK